MIENIIINFHDQICLRIETDSDLVKSFYRDEYAAHLNTRVTNEMSCISLSIRIGSSHTDNISLIPASHKFVARWNYKVEQINEEIHIKANTNYFGLFMLHHMIVHPCIRYLIAKKGILMLHAGAVSKNGRSIIFTGKGGAGKTTLTSQLLADNDDILPHSDDYVFLESSSQSLAYITRSHIYYDLLQRVPVLKNRLSFNERVRVWLFSEVRKLTGDSIKWPTRISQDRLWPNKNIDFRAKPAGIIFISRERSEHPRLEKVSEISNFTEKLLDMNFSEAKYFIDLIRRHPDGGLPENWLEEWEDSEYGLLVNILEKTPHYNLILPDTIQNPKKIKQSVNELLYPILK